MRRSVLLVPVLLIANAMHAQTYGNIWQFGDQAGLDFTACDPVALTNGANTGYEGCSTICDPTGQVLFYTNSETVWDRQDNPMPNGALVPSGSTLSQVVIVPKPLSGSLYYIFTTDIQGGGGLSFRFHVVDMTLHGGLGDLASSNTVLSALSISEHVTATRHANGTDIWVMTHEYGSNAFLAFLLTSAGISAQPVISNSGPPLLPCNSNTNARGELKFSIDGSKLAISGNGVGNDVSSNVLSLFHFDNATGMVSDPLPLPFERGDFGMSFSPDGSKLYGSTWKALNFMGTDINTLYQFDLSSNDSTTIVNSKVVLDSSATNTPFGSLQIGPDGRIYSARSQSLYLGVINEPDLLGTACNYVRDGFYLDGRLCKFGLNNLIQYVNCDGATSIHAVTDQKGLTLTLMGGDELSLTCNAPSCESTYRITVLDELGRTVHKADMTPGSAMDLSEFTPGVYVVRVSGAAGQRLLVQKIALGL